MPRRFHVLDGMRGIAAALVMLHHVEIHLLATHWLQAGYLAVDFFFMLSGFVIATSYEHRFATGLAPPVFMWLRLKRLWPMMACGILAGAAVALAKGVPLSDVAVMLPPELLFIPVVAGTIGVYVLNGVQWSLLFELFANAVHAIFGRLLSVTSLAIIALLSLMVVTVCARLHGALSLGDTGGNVIGGFPRVLFSYTVGILLFRTRNHWPTMIMPGWVAISLLPLVFVVAGTARMIMPVWCSDLATVALILPVLFMAGANAAPTPRLRFTARWLGGLSYPLYAVHLSAISCAGMFFSGSVAALLAVTIAVPAALVLTVLLEPGGRDLAAVPDYHSLKRIPAADGVAECGKHSASNIA